MMHERRKYTYHFVFMFFIMLLVSACSDTAATETTPTGLPTDTSLPAASTATQTEAPSPFPPTVTPSPLPTIIPAAPVEGQVHPLALDLNSVQDIQLLREVGTGMQTETLWSPDGKYLVRAMSQGIYFYDSETLQETIFIDTGYPTRNLVFSPDNSRLALSAGSRVEVWSVESGERLLEMEAVFDFVRKIEYSPTGYIAAIGPPHFTFEPGEAVMIWDADTGEELYSDEGIYDLRSDMAMSPDGKTLAYATNGNILFLDMGTPPYVLRDTVPLVSETDFVYELTFLPDGEHVFVLTYDYGGASNNGPGYIFSINGGAIDEVLPGNECDQLSYQDEIFICLDSREMVAFSYPGWVEEYRYISESGIEAVEFSPQGDKIAVSSFYDLVIADFASGAELLIFDQIRIEKLAIGMRRANNSNQYIAATTEHGRIDYWDLITGELLHSMQISEVFVVGLAFSPNQKTLASIDELGVVRLIDVNTYSITRSYDLEGASKEPLLYSLDGREITFLYGIPPAVYTLDLQTQELSPVGDETFYPNYNWPSQVPFIYDSVGDSLTWAWNEDSITIRTINGGGDYVFPYDMERSWVGPEAVAISNDGRYAAIGLDSSQILIGDTEKLEIVRELEGHSIEGGHGPIGTFEYLTFSLVNDLLLSMGWDGTIRLWDIVTGVELHSTGGTYPAFTPDGRFLVVEANDLIRVWGVPPLP